MLTTTPETRGGTIRLQIREEEREVSYIDQVSLLCVHVPDGYKLGVTVDGRIFAFDPRTVASTESLVWSRSNVSERDGMIGGSGTSGYLRITAQPPSVVEGDTRIFLRGVIDAKLGKTGGAREFGIEAGPLESKAKTLSKQIGLAVIPCSSQLGSREIIHVPSRGGEAVFYVDVTDQLDDQGRIHLELDLTPWIWSRFRVTLLDQREGMS